MSQTKTCINPKTGRPITVGGATWRTLVHDKVIEGEIVAPIYEAETPQEAKVAKKLITKQQPAKHGYTHKIAPNSKRVILARKKLTHKQLTDYMLQCTAKVMQSKDDIDPNMSEDEINNILSDRVLQMMLTDGKITKGELKKFAIKEESESDDEEEEDESQTETEDE